MAALGVDQHQGLVGRHAAQRGGADRVGAVGQAGRGKFSEGSATDSAWFISVLPLFLSVSAEMMSTGAAVSSAVRLATRVPVTTTVAAFSVGGTVWATAAPLANKRGDG